MAAKHACLIYGQDMKAHPLSLIPVGPFIKSGNYPLDKPRSAISKTYSILTKYGLTKIGKKYSTRTDKFQQFFPDLGGVIEKMRKQLSG